MSYRKTYFRVRTDGYEPGWSSEAASDRFDAECRALIGRADFFAVLASGFSQSTETPHFFA